MIEQLQHYKNASKRLVLLDYDGTLVNLSSLPSQANPTQQTIKVLKQLTEKVQTKTIVITGRSHIDIEHFIGHLPIDIIAEHGAMAKDHTGWKKRINDSLWKSEVAPVMDSITAICPKSFVEQKSFSLAWHYRNADEETGYLYSRKLIDKLEGIVQLNNLKIIDGNKVVEIISKETSKGIATKDLVEQGNYDWIICIGDDKTDEDMFECLLSHKNALTIKVGEGNILAKYRMKSVEEVLLFLEQL
ncbi:trehalose-phosphatase [Solitalea koreensis]|uniref:Trehalose 6-phosphate phosphatase n=1 Tax=Solitalea koreensis TaxID=543615 RepID=A0A521CEK5_9SPHI|nr:trehalose-phosphatase [Solitalea koreensis]SMO57859.1 trehalose 6-phosphatase [Solitalea koreensis]